MIDLTGVVSAAITLILAILSAFLIPLIKQKADAEKLDVIRMWVTIAVSAAEQIFGHGTGEAKKEYVLKFLSDKGFTVNAEDIDNLIEAAVLELKNSI